MNSEPAGNVTVPFHEVCGFCLCEMADSLKTPDCETNTRDMLRGSVVNPLKHFVYNIKPLFIAMFDAVHIVLHRNHTQIIKKRSLVLYSNFVHVY